MTIGKAISRITCNDDGGPGELRRGVSNAVLSGGIIQRSPEQGPFTHVLFNKGALTKTFDEHITVSGVNLQVNGVDVRRWHVYGLHGQVAFFHVKGPHIDHSRCLDLGRAQYAIHIRTFEDIIIDDVQIRGNKDGAHLGRGKLATRVERISAEVCRLLQGKANVDAWGPLASGFSGTA